MTDQIIIQEAARLVADGISVTFPVKGRSMIPFIIGGKESVILQRPDNLKVGHVILAEVGLDRYVVHRIIRIDKESGRITLMGDGNIRGTESCMQQHVLARATHVVDPQGRRRPLESRRQMFKARIWYWIRPFRRIILAVLRRTIRKYKI
ncbi:MAG: S24/S26 family peptidase [Bacteroidaceae bacterium]|nr:S24/S26 family peptidase [Bacteroidaceae bacterium]